MFEGIYFLMISLTNHIITVTLNLFQGLINKMIIIIGVLMLKQVQHDKTEGIFIVF